MTNQSVTKSEISIPKHIFYNIFLINMVQIEKISNVKLEEISFDWFGSEEFECLSLIDSELFAPNFVINEDTTYFNSFIKR